MSLDSDPEIAAAFGSADTSSAASTSSDPEISAAFASRDDSTPKKSLYDPNRPTFGAPLGNAVIDLGGAIARGVGTVGDAFRNTVRTFEGKPNIDYGSPESYGTALSAPFTHAPDAPESAPDVKEQIRRGLPKLTDQPIVRKALDSPAGQTLTQDVAKPLAMIAPAAAAVAPVLGATGAPEAEAFTPEAVVSRTAAEQSGGAAGAARDLSNTSPELRQAITQAAQKTGGAVNPEALDKQLKADEFGIRLTQGQATGDGAQLADEFNTRNQNPAFAERKVQTNQKLIDGINGIKEDVAPAAAVDHEGNAQTVIDAYKDKYAPIAADAKAKWTKFQDAAGGALPLEPGDFTTQIGAALKKTGKTRYLPADVAGDIKDIDDGEPFTVERWDNLKTNLAGAQRTAERTGNGNAGLAISAARDAVENYQFPNLDPKLQAMNNEARAATSQKYAMLRADPAMDAAVNDGVPRGQLSPEAKGYMEKYFLKGNKADLEKAQANLAGNPDAQGAIAGSVTNELKKAAGIDLYRNDGNFSQSGYNTRLNELQPRIKYLMDPDAADKAFRLGDVARDAQRQPTGYGFNNSGTSVAAQVAKRVGAGALNAAEHVANMATGKLKLGTGAREEIENWKDSKWVEDSLKPGAGLDKLKTTP